MFKNIKFFGNQEQNEQESSAQVFLGTNLMGENIYCDLALAHTLIVGITRSGKTTCLYNIISQLKEHSSIRVVGCDSTGLLLNPFAAYESKIALGLSDKLSDIKKHLDVLDWLVVETYRRILLLQRAGKDQFFEDDFSPEFPRIFCVLEEFYVLKEVITSFDKSQKPMGKLAEHLIRSVRLLSALSLKTGVCLIMSLQRADAEFMSGFARQNFINRFIFKSENNAAAMVLNNTMGFDDLSQLPTGECICSIVDYKSPMILNSHRIKYKEYLEIIKSTLLEEKKLKDMSVMGERGKNV